MEFPDNGESECLHYLHMVVDRLVTALIHRITERFKGIRFHMKSGSYMGIRGAKDGDLYLRSLQCLQVQEKGKTEA